MYKFPDNKKNIPFLRAIPDRYKDVQNKQLQVLERGERSYLIRNFDSKRFPYRVMERRLTSDS